MPISRLALLTMRACRLVVRDITARLGERAGLRLRGAGCATLGDGELSHHAAVFVF